MTSSEGEPAGEEKHPYFPIVFDDAYESEYADGAFFIHEEKISRLIFYREEIMIGKNYGIINNNRIVSIRFEVRMDHEQAEDLARRIHAIEMKQVEIDKLIGKPKDEKERERWWELNETVRNTIADSKGTLKFFESGPLRDQYEELLVSRKRKKREGDIPETEDIHEEKNNGELGRV